jgi:4'-phosphopantetheinyl transferase
LPYSFLAPFSNQDIRIIVYEASYKLSYNQQKIISHNCVEHLLGKAEIAPPIDVGRTIYGKPQLRNSNIHINFNISHSENLTVGISHSLPVGIDIENEKRHCEMPDDYIYSEIFASKLEAIDALSTNTLIELWTIKEAVLKASGYGLWGGLKNVVIKMVNRNKGTAYFTNQKYEIELSDIKKFVVAIAIHSKT